MDYDEILKKIIRLYGVKTENVRLTQVIESKLKKHTATYADAQNYAQAIGKALTEAFREYLPEALTDGKLYRAAAEVLMQQPMVRASRDIDKVAGAIQAEINENAGLGINPIVPEINQDQIDGIITGICNAESYDAGKEVLFDQVENFMEGHVDDFVRENADFQYQAGLDPKVIRTAAGKCCKWCSNLAGTYKYEDVKDRGNDVWRRHRNCHCVIEYDPGQKGGKKKTVSGDRSLIEQEKADRMSSKDSSFRKTAAFNSSADPMADAFGRGVDSHPKEIEAFREECRKCGVEILERERESLKYMPNCRVGQPGVLSVSKGASYSAWCHEMQHMRDDRESGWDGIVKVWDRNEHVRREEVAYGIEIKLAEEAGRKDIADMLRDNLEAERWRIMNAP